MSNSATKSIALLIVLLFGLFLVGCSRTTTEEAAENYFMAIYKEDLKAFKKSFPEDELVKLWPTAENSVSNIDVSIEIIDGLNDPDLDEQLVETIESLNSIVKELNGEDFPVEINSKTFEDDFKAIYNDELKQIITSLSEDELKKFYSPSGMLDFDMDGFLTISFKSMNDFLKKQYGEKWFEEMKFKEVEKGDDRAIVEVTVGGKKQEISLMKVNGKWYLNFPLFLNLSE